MQHLNWIDYVILVIIGLSTVISLARGFVREALSLVTWIVALWVALTFSKSLTPSLQPYIHSGSLRYIIAFAALFIIVLLVGALINGLITRIAEKTGLSGTDRILGVVFGFARGVLLVAIVLIAAQLTALPKQAAWHESSLIPKFAPVENWLAHYIPEDINLHLKSKPNSNNNINQSISSNSNLSGVQ